MDCRVPTRTGAKRAKEDPMAEILGSDFNDILIGSDDSDQIYGFQGDDLLLGMSGNDEIHGEEGADLLVGLDGDDLLYGGSDADVFAFGEGSGHDTIADFADQQDRIDLTSLTTLHDFGQILAHSSQSGADTVIDLGAAAGHAGGEDVLTLAGFDMARLDASDFILS
jgi:Ca2+-binding RTX toxin-like protein